MNSGQFAFAVTLFTGIFVGICMFFDRQRHNDPSFKKKLRMKRVRDRFLKKSDKDDNKGSMENLNEQEATILYEIELAERLMEQQDLDKAIVHFANAIAVCVDPCNLLAALKQSLPSYAFELLVQVLISNYGKKFSRLQQDGRIRKLLQNQDN